MLHYPPVYLYRWGRGDARAAIPRTERVVAIADFEGDGRIMMDFETWRVEHEKLHDRERAEWRRTHDDLVRQLEGRASTVSLEELSRRLDTALEQLSAIDEHVRPKKPSALEMLRQWGALIFMIAAVVISSVRGPSTVDLDRVAASVERGRQEQIQEAKSLRREVLDETRSTRDALTQAVQQQARLIERVDNLRAAVDQQRRR